MSDQTLCYSGAKGQQANDSVDWTGATDSFEFVVSEAEQNSFAALSGDFNPLHLDPGFAQARGLAGSVVFGGLIVAKVSQVIGMRLPGPRGIWGSLKIDFREPLYVGRTACLSTEVSHFSEATRSLSLKILVTSEGHKIATGTALATLHAD